MKQAVYSNLSNQKQPLQVIASSMSSDSEDNICSEDEAVGLCDACQRIDFAKAFQDPLPTLREILSFEGYNGIFVANLDSFDRNCKLCGSSDLHPSYGASLWEADESYDWELRAVPNPLIAELEEKEYQDIAATCGSRWLLAVPKGRVFGSGSPGFGSFARYALQFGWYACLPSKSSPRMFQPQRIAWQFDPRLIHKWTNACKSFHGIPCQVPDDIDVPGLLLINCNTNQICAAPANAKYVALSYVWAKTAMAMPLASSKSGQAKLLPPLHWMSQTVTDSICVTKQLGFTYLWIDKYCIKQHDTAHKMAQINMMDRIYKRAELTIIAAAGDDENKGLPGVQSTLRHRQTLFEHGPYTVMLVPPDISLYSESSKWATRGWTFQEDILSSRRLFFGFHETFFTCQGMQCREALRSVESTKDDNEVQCYSEASTSSINHDNYKAISKSLEPSGAFLDNVLENLHNKPDAAASRHLRQVRCLLMDYTPRALTYNSDALSAFSGIFSHFEDGEFPVYNIQGLPILFTKRSLMQLEGGMAMALCWDSRYLEESERRPDFPSWTWAGWTGQVDFPHDFGLGHNLEFLPRNVSLEYRDKSIVSLETVASHVADDSKSVATWQSLVLLKSHSLLHERPNSIVNSADLSAPIGLCFCARLIPDAFFSFQTWTSWAGATFMGLPLRKTRNTDIAMLLGPQEFLNGLRAGELGCLLLGIETRPDNNPRVVVHLLIVEWIKLDEAQRMTKFQAGGWEEGEFGPTLEKALRSLEIREIKLY